MPIVERRYNNYESGGIVNVYVYVKEVSPASNALTLQFLTDDDVG